MLFRHACIASAAARCSVFIGAPTRFSVPAASDETLGLGIRAERWCCYKVRNRWRTRALAVGHRGLEGASRALLWALAPSIAELLVNPDEPFDVARDAVEARD